MCLLEPVEWKRSEFPRHGLQKIHCRRSPPAAILVVQFSSFGDLPAVIHIGRKVPTGVVHLDVLCDRSRPDRSFKITTLITQYKKAVGLGKCRVPNPPAVTP